MVGWIRPDDDHLLVRRVGNDGVLGATFDVSGESLSFLNAMPTVAANASGRVAAAWRRPSDSDVRVRVFDAQTGPAAAALDLSADADIALFGTNVSVAINDAGEAAVVWHRNTDCHIIARRVTAAGVVGAQLDLSGEPDSAVGDTTPTVALRPDGTVVGAWHRDTDHHGISRRWAADGATGPVVDLSLANGVPSMANLAITPLADGDAVAWQRETDAHIVTATGNATAAPAPEDVSLAPAASVTPPSIATTADGALALAWVGGDGTARVAFSAGVAGPSPSTPSPGSTTTTPAPSTTEAPSTGTPTPPTRAPTAAPTPVSAVDLVAPQTSLRAQPAARTTRTTAILRFVSSEAGSTFRCSLDGVAESACAPRLTLRRLTPGRHVLRVRAVDAAGNADPTPAVARFRVVRRR